MLAPVALSLCTMVFWCGGAEGTRAGVKVESAGFQDHFAVFLSKQVRGAGLSAKCLTKRR